MSFGKNKMKVYGKKEEDISFNDVAGLD